MLPSLMRSYNRVVQPAKEGNETCISLQKNRYHGKRQYLFIESICNDPDILAQNYRYKMMYSPDYRTTSEEEVYFTCPFVSSHCASAATGPVEGSMNLM